MAVTTEYGVLLGQVSEVGATESTVITILDTTFSAAAFVGGDNIDDAEGTVTVRGDFTQMRNGLLTLDYIDDELTVNPGAEVYTSGAGAVFPAGLMVGNVVRVYDHASGIGRYATVRPARDIERLENMFVIIEFENPD
jgi:rod shape-determining protein MreC